MIQSTRPSRLSMILLAVAVLFTSLNFNAQTSTYVSGQVIEAVDFLVTTDFTNATNEDQHFIARIYDPTMIAMARAEIEKLDPPFMIIAGTIVNESADWNPDWSFHIDPSTVLFGDLFVEICDANVEFVEENLDVVGGAFLPNSFWCPWSSRVLEEVGNETVIFTMEPGMDLDDGNQTEVPSDMPSLEPSLSPSSSFGAPTVPAPTVPAPTAAFPTEVQSSSSSSPTSSLDFTLPPVPPESGFPSPTVAPTTSAACKAALVSSIMVVLGMTTMIGVF